MRPFPIVYIGETTAKNGPLGRLSFHMQDNGTFVSKCKDRNVDLMRIDDDIKMIAIDLADYPLFCGEVNKSNRCALEHFVNLIMEEYSVADDTKIPFEVVSKTRILSRLAEKKEYQELADVIAHEFYDQLPFVEGA